MKKLLLLIAFFSSTVYNLTAQSSEIKIKKIEFQKKSFKAQQIDFAPGNGLNRDAFIPLLKSNFGYSQNSDFEILNVESDKLGYVATHYNYYLNGTLVEGGDIIIIEKDAELYSFIAGPMTNFEKNIKPTSNSLSVFTALENAKKAIGAESYKWENVLDENFLKSVTENPNATYFPIPSSTMVYAPFKGNFEGTDFRKAYKFDIYASKPLGRYFVYVDATSGEVMNIVSRIHVSNATGTATTRYNGTKTISTDLNGSTYRLRTNVALSTGRKLETYNMNNGTNYSSATEFTDADNNWTADPVANSCHFGAEATYDFYKNTFNRNSYDNAGASIKSYVHYDQGYVNAYWDGTQMTYGDGDGTNYGPLTSLDVCGHEISHAVTEKTSNLAYQNESGALNESFSDIFGECIENFATGTKDWLIGADFDLKYHKGFRNFKNPNAEGQPDTYKGTNWVANAAFPNSTINDNGGVHTNSGVQNFWFYLLSVGGSGTNDNSNTYSVTGIGMDKAAAIAYRTNSMKLTSSSKFADARTGSIAAAKELYGNGSQEEISVTNAWYAVGVGAAYSGPAPCSTPAGLSASSISSTSATLNWSAVSGAASYNIRYKLTSSGTWTNGTSASTSLNISGLTAGSNYEFQVQTVCSGTSSSSFSSSSNFTTSSGTQTCTTPSSLSASAVSTNSATLNWGAVSGAVSYNVEYKLSSASTYTSVNSTTNSYSLAGLTANTSYDFRVQSVCSGSSTSAVSSVYTFTTSAGTVTYCTSKGTSAASEWIKQVQIGTINNATGANAGYADFTSISTDLVQGSNNTITLTPGFSSGVLGQNSYPEYFRVYIDFNKDGDFVDAGELAFDAGSTSTTAKTGTLVIPSNALLGATRMRVQMKYNAAPTSCETFSEGEVEDYTANITGNTPPVCNASNGLNATSITSSSATLSWTAVSGAVSYNLAYKTSAGSTFTTVNTASTSYALTGLSASTSYDFKVQTVCSGSSTSAYTATSSFTTSAAVCNSATGLSANSITTNSAVLSWTAVSGAQSYNLDYKLSSASTYTTLNTSGTSYSLSGLNPNTAYDFRVQTVCSGTSTSAYSAISSFTTSPTSVSYCTSKGNSASSEWIKQVQIGTINNVTAANAGYGDFTSISTNLTRGSSNNITLTPGFSNGVLGPNAYPEYWKVYIDFNQDGDFSDAGELAFDAGSTSTTAKSGVLTVPSTASLGSTRMRVQMKYNAATANACETFSEGEVEDYTANILAPAGFVNLSNASKNIELTASNVSMFPNPSNSFVNLKINFSEKEEFTYIRFIDLNGKIIKEKVLESLPKGENLVQLELNDINNGIYQVNITSSTVQSTLKLIIVH